MTTAGDGSRAARPIVSLPSADRETVPLAGIEEWLGTASTDDAAVSEPDEETDE